MPSKLILFDCSLISTKDFHSGLSFQVICVMGPKKRYHPPSSLLQPHSSPLLPPPPFSSRLNCVALGGRYDRLVTYFEEQSRAPKKNISPSSYASTTITLSSYVESVCYFLSARHRANTIKEQAHGISPSFNKSSASSTLPLVLSSCFPSWCPSFPSPFYLFPCRFFSVDELIGVQVNAALRRLYIEFRRRFEH